MADTTFTYEANATIYNHVDAGTDFDGGEVGADYEFADAGVNGGPAEGSTFNYPED